MKLIRSVGLVSVAILLGAVAMACGDYTVSGDASSINSGAIDGSTVNPGTSGTDVPSGASGTNGTVNPGGTGGANGTINPGVTGGTDGTVIPSGTGGTGGTVNPGGTAGTDGTVIPSGTGGIDNPGGTGGTEEPPIGPTLPGDVLNNAGIAVVAAYSTVRVIVSGYSGPLYQVCKGRADPGPGSCKSGDTQDIGIVDGYGDAAAQDAFCSGGSCTITTIYDQSGYGNLLEPSPRGQQKTLGCYPANAADLPVTINGRSAYGILIEPAVGSSPATRTGGSGYRGGCTDCTNKTGNGTAVDDEPQTMYMVTSQLDLIDDCCFSFGNAELNSTDLGPGHMEAIYFGYGVAVLIGGQTVWGSGVQGGPWVMADIEDCLFAGWESGQWDNISTNTPVKHDFVTAMVVGDTGDKNGGKGRIALYGGDATAGAVTVMYDGIRPETPPGYVPAKKQGSIILGTGGDTSNMAGGRFYEGVMANGVASQEILNALQESIVAARYGQ